MATIVLTCPAAHKLTSFYLAAEFPAAVSLFAAAPQRLSARGNAIIAAMPVAERIWLQQLRRKLPAASSRGAARVRLGMGDDAALIDPGAGFDVAVTTDLFLEDVHFLRAHDTALSCGHRIATRAFSDLAAMGAEPVCLFLSCGFPAGLPTAWTRALYRGLQQACDAAGAGIAGGDVASSPHGILVDVIGLGRVRRKRALLRSGARPGDRLFVSGIPGMGSRGRELVHGGLRPRTREDRMAVARHRQPRARWELGMALSRLGLASAAIDISDGVSTDLDHLCEESGVGAVIDAARMPLLSLPDGLQRALEGGEDYELLFTVPPRKAARLRRLNVPGVVCTEIGEIVARPGMWLRSPNGKKQRLRPRGWEHFRKSQSVR